MEIHVTLATVLPGQLVVEGALLSEAESDLQLGEEKTLGRHRFTVKSDTTV